MRLASIFFAVSFLLSLPLWISAGDILFKTSEVDHTYENQDSTRNIQNQRSQHWQKVDSKIRLEYEKLAAKGDTETMEKKKGDTRERSTHKYGLSKRLFVCVTTTDPIEMTQIYLLKKKLRVNIEWIDNDIREIAGSIPYQNLENVAKLPFVRKIRALSLDDEGLPQYWQKADISVRKTIKGFRKCHGAGVFEVGTEIDTAGVLSIYLLIDNRDSIKIDALKRIGVRVYQPEASEQLIFCRIPYQVFEDVLRLEFIIKAIPSHPQVGHYIGVETTRGDTLLRANLARD